MHYLIGLSVLAGLIGFAFGWRVARAFLGALLLCGAAAVLLFVIVVAGAVVQQNERQPVQTTESEQAAAVKKFTNRMVRQCAGDVDCLFPEGSK